MLDDTSKTNIITLPEAQGRFARGDFDDAWAEQTRLKIRGSVNKIPKVYRAVAGMTSPQLIVCDVASHDALFERYLLSKTAPEHCGFKSYSSFYTWYSNSRRFMDVASGSRVRKVALSALDDDWAQLINHLSGQCGTPAWFDQYDMIAISILAAECRERGIAIAQLSASLIMQFVPELRSVPRDAIRNACRLIDSLRETNMVPSDLLPRSPIGSLPTFVASGRPQTPPVGAAYAISRDAYIAKRIKGSKVLPLGSEKREISTHGLGPDRAKSIKQGIDWYWSGLSPVSAPGTSELIL